jgi:hypothetical protein
MQQLDWLTDIVQMTRYFMFEQRTAAAASHRGTPDLRCSVPRTEQGQATAARFISASARGQ